MKQDPKTLDWLDRRPSLERLQSPEFRYLSASLMLGCRLGAVSETAPIAAVLEHWLGDARMVRIMVATGALLSGNSSLARAELARERHSYEADAGVLLLAIADKLAGNSDDWKGPVERVLATSIDPTLRSMAYQIEKLD